MQAVAGELRSVAEDRAPDPEALEAVERRLGLISKLRGKYGPALSDVLAFQAEAERELAALETDEHDAGTLEAEVDALQARAAQAGLRAARRPRSRPPRRWPPICCGSSASWACRTPGSNSSCAR